MYFVYSLLLGLAFLVLLPRFILDAFYHGKYVQGFRERLGSLSAASTAGRPVIWIHCVSVGETQAARPLVKRIKERFPEHSIAISTVTLTGQKLAAEVFEDVADRVFYFPFDWGWTVRRTLRSLNPSVVVILETELWPGFLRECGRRQIPVAIVNGRLSEQSFRRYRLIKFFMARVLKSVSLALMQTEADAERMRQLGMAAGRIKVSGSLKFDAGPAPVSGLVVDNFRSRFGLGGASLILAASTHNPEEQIILRALRQVVANSDTSARLMIAPRHPERFAEVAGLIATAGFSWARRSAPAQSTDRLAQVILLDSIGELQSLYSLADIVFVGGSIAKTGGHNIIEPAAAGASVITGAHTYNFKLIVEGFVKAGAILQLPPMPEAGAPGELACVISELLADPMKRGELGKRARELVNQNQGATEHTLEMLVPLIPNTPAPSNRVGRLRVQGAST